MLRYLVIHQTNILMSKSLKIAAVLIIIAAAANIFLLFHNNIKRSDLTQTQSTPISTPTPPSNVTVVDGKQIITIAVKGGYSPQITTAQADSPTVLKMVTNGTFDCSSAVSIPSLNYQKNLPATGETLIDVPAQTKGTTLNGTCAMGMYHFSIKFE
jgi:plastocyanin domain-containing protein